MISDEMIRAFHEASDKIKRHLDPMGEKRTRAGLEAVAPMIRAQAREEAGMVLVPINPTDEMVAAAIDALKG